MMMPTEHLALIVDDVQRDRLAAAEDYRRTRAGARKRGRFPMPRRSAAGPGRNECAPGAPPEVVPASR